MSSTATLGTAPASTPTPAPQLLDRLRTQPKLPLIVGAAALVAAAAAFMLWSRGPEYKVLYTNISDRDGGAIIASLQQMNVPYKFAEGGGAILVASDKVPEVRLQLAGQGLPKGGGVGFELMDNQKFGTSQFAEQINYQRALEGELARSIESIGTVESARVHLALPKPSLFVRDQKKPSASVVLTLQRGRSIDEGQVSAIVHMISSSVPELDPKGVTVVDQRGNLLSAANSGARGLDVSQLKYTQEIEQGYVRRIEAILQPVVGAANVRAQVAAEIDFSVVEATDEKYRPNQDPAAMAVRSQQSSESSQHGGTPPGGIPGALTNQPPTNPSAPIITPKPPTGPTAPTAPGAAPGAAAGASTTTTTAPSGPGSMRKDTVTNYELDRSIRHVQQGAGAIRRLSVAVVVNDKEVSDGGKASARALTPAEIEQIRNLAREAVGFSQERGDSLNVVNTTFAQEDKEPPAPPVAIWRDPQNIDLAKTLGQYLLLAGLALFAWLAVARPLMRKHLAPPAPPPAPIAAPPAPVEAPTEAPAPEESLQDRELNRQKAIMDYAHQTADRDPKLVAALIQHWMNTP